MTLGDKIRNSGHITVDGVDFEGYYLDSGNIIIMFDDDGNDGRVFIDKDEQARDMTGEYDTEVDGHHLRLYKLEQNLD